MNARIGSPRGFLSAAIAVAGLLAAGSLATAKLVTRTDTVVVPADGGVSQATATATCPRGKRVVLGGLNLKPTDPNDQITLSRFSLAGKRRWRTQAINFGSDQPKLTAIAYCRAFRGRVVATRASITAPSQGPTDPNATVTARCPRGKRLLFGGYDEVAHPEQDMWVGGAYRSGARAWTVEAINFEPATTLTAIAYCSARAPRVSEVSSSRTVPGDTPAQLSARCPKGHPLVFGGFRGEVTGNDAFVLLRKLRRSDPRTWAVGAINENGSHAGSLTAFAYCTKRRR